MLQEGTKGVLTLQTQAFGMQDVKPGHLSTYLIDYAIHSNKLDTILRKKNLKSLKFTRY